MNIISQYYIYMLTLLKKFFTLKITLIKNLNLDLDLSLGLEKWNHVKSRIKYVIVEMVSVNALEKKPKLKKWKVVNEVKVVDEYLSNP